MKDDKIQVDRELLRQAMTLYKNIETADGVFQSCQSSSFRSFVRETYKARNMEQAFRKIAALVGETV